MDGLSPVLAADVPSAENGGLPDERTVVYRLRPGVMWADGRPFTADDVVFTHQFIADPQTASTTGQAYQLVERVESLDELTVRMTFKEPTAGWYVPFVGRQGSDPPASCTAGRHRRRCAKRAVQSAAVRDRSVRGGRLQAGRSRDLLGESALSSG